MLRLGRPSMLGGAHAQLPDKGVVKIPHGQGRHDHLCDAVIAALDGI